MAQNRFTQPFKSLNNDIRAFVSFVNTTNRNVCLLWLDYKGKRVRYGDIPPGRGLLMNTYVTHPWIAYDVVTSYPLLFNGEMAFFPQEQRDNQVFSEDNRELVSIHIPGK
ncbi:hypothetical protein DPMN_018352 [Dreissena polymorpha]|uniref:von Hippel-Lindau disease tumour suppressor beta domain-containing protein n=1 Tax=Dreissena polymorpha TaxID=45954 RepID=A0A9D4S877_DREPO|nr:hypothetical protein DPMN_018352 [Dreissena polymorpha]